MWVPACSCRLSIVCIHIIDILQNMHVWWYWYTLDYSCVSQIVAWPAVIRKILTQPSKPTAQNLQTPLMHVLAAQICRGKALINRPIGREGLWISHDLAFTPQFIQFTAIFEEPKIKNSFNPPALKALLLCFFSQQIVRPITWNKTQKDCYLR
mgnify:CR=1 FL=1